MTTGELTSEQISNHQANFFSMAALGTSCGCLYPSEWLGHYLHTLMMWCKYEDIPRLEHDAMAAMAYFYRQSACGPEEAEEFAKMSDIDLINKMDKYYNALHQKNIQDESTAPSVHPNN